MNAVTSLQLLNSLDVIVSIATPKIVKLIIYKKSNQSAILFKTGSVFSSLMDSIVEFSYLVIHI
jgi:hypothetical protein